MTNVRLRHLAKVGPRAGIARLIADDAEVTFAPMDTLADGLGGLDTSLTRHVRELASGSYNFFADGDLLLAKVTPCFENGKKALAEGLANGVGFATSEVHVIRPDARRVDPRYLFYVLSSEDFRAAGMASMTGAGGLRRVSESAVLDYRPRITDLPTQAAIADFLDRETARINQLIEKKQRLVETLLAKQEAIRDVATCKGLNPDVPYKHSGVDWFGDVPAHWSVCRFNRLIASKADYRGRTPEKVDDGIFLVTARNIRAGRIDYERSQEFTTAHDWEKLSSRGKPEIGDVIFTTEAPLGQIAQVDRLDVAFAQRIMKFRANKKFVSNDFLAQFMMSASFQRSLQLYASGSTASGIKSERMAHLFGLVPPAGEQSKIIESVCSEIERLNVVLAPVEKSIDRLREFRAALITSAVTGEIEVAEWHRFGATDRRLDKIQEPMRA